MEYIINVTKYLLSMYQNIYQEYIRISIINSMKYIIKNAMEYLSLIQRKVAPNAREFFIPAKFNFLIFKNYHK